MSLIENNIEFWSGIPVDKIAYIPDTSYTKLVSAFTAETVEITNPLGYKAFITLRWSVDNINFYPAQAFYAADAPYTSNGWVNDSTIFIYFENNTASSATFYVDYVLDTIT